MLPAQEKLNRNAANQALWLIAETNDTIQVEAVLASGAQIDARNDYGTTALMRAAAKGRTHMVRVLLEHGADPNRSRNDKFTPLLLAAFFGHEEIVRILAEHGAQTDAATRFGTSAQMWAASRTFKDVVQYLKHPQSDPQTKQVIKTRLTDRNQRAGVTAIAEDKAKVTTTTPTADATVERARRLVGLPATADKLQSVPEPSQSPESIAMPSPRRSSLVHFSKGVAFYAFTALLVLVAVVGFTLQRAQRLKEVSPQKIGSVADDKSVVDIPGVTNSVTNSPTNNSPSGGEISAATTVGSPTDKVAVDREVNRTNDKPPRLVAPLAPRTRSADTSGNNYFQEKQVSLTNIDQTPTSPVPTSSATSPTDLAVAPVTLSPKPKFSDPSPAKTATPASVKRTTPASTELITGSKTSAPKGKVIQWP